jgi:hypothetical protein
MLPASSAGRAAAWVSFDDFVGAGEGQRWQVDAERLGGPKVKSKLEFCGLLDRKIGGICALENLVYEHRKSTRGAHLLGGICSEH